MAARGKRVLLLDADPAAPVAAALKLGGEPARGAPLGPIRARATSVPLFYVGSPYTSAHPAAQARDLAQSLEAVAERNSRHYDLVVIDAPASLCEATADFARASDAAVVVQLAHTPEPAGTPRVPGAVEGTPANEGAAVRLFGLLLTLPPGLPVGSAGETALRQPVQGAAARHDPARPRRRRSPLRSASRSWSRGPTPRFRSSYLGLRRPTGGPLAVRGDRREPHPRRAARGRR